MKIEQALKQARKNLQNPLERKKTEQAMQMLGMSAPSLNQQAAAPAANRRKMSEINLPPGHHDPAAKMGTHNKSPTMSYTKAKEIFADVHKHVTDKSDPVAFDLSNGLHVLCGAIEDDNAEIKRRLDRIETLVQSLKR
jgi:hypothetical protein